MRRPWSITKRMVIRFYDDQMTQHAAAITYYSLMSLFPAILFGLSILGLVGEYPRTYDAIVRYLNDVAPPSVVRPIDESLRDAFRNKSTATTGLFLSIFLAFFGTTGVLESIRRALNVVFAVRGGRRFLHRKAVDVVSTFALLGLVLCTLVFVVVGKGPAEDILRLVGADENAAQIWGLLRWPAAVASALLGFSYVYFVTPDLKHKAFHLVTPGAILGVVAWLLVSYGLSEYISNVVNIGALYGAFTGAIVVVLWLWLSSCSLLLGAELNAAIAWQRTVEDGTAEDAAGRAAAPEQAERRPRRTWRERRSGAREDAGGADVPTVVHPVAAPPEDDPDAPPEGDPDGAEAGPRAAGPGAPPGFGAQAAGAAVVEDRDAPPPPRRRAAPPRTDGSREDDAAPARPAAEGPDDGRSGDDGGPASEAPTAVLPPVGPAPPVSGPVPPRD